MTPSPVLTVYSQSGAALAKAKVMMDLNFEADGATAFPTGIYPNLKAKGVYTSDGSGKVYLDKFKVKT